MDLSEHQRNLLRLLPAVDRLLELAKTEACFELVPASVVVNAIRTVIDEDRRRIREGDPTPGEKDLAAAAVMPRVKDAVRSEPERKAWCVGHTV